MQLERPAWKSKEKQEIVRALYQGNSEVMLRERLGVVTEGSDGVFLRKRIKALFEKDRQPVCPTARHIYVAIDPSGGGPSHFAVCSAIRHEGSLQVRRPVAVWVGSVACIRTGTPTRTSPEGSRRWSCSLVANRRIVAVAAE